MMSKRIVSKWPKTSAILRVIIEFGHDSARYYDVANPIINLQFGSIPPVSGEIGDGYGIPMKSHLTTIKSH